MSDVPDDELLPGVPGVVVERLRAELGPPAEKILVCLRTAVALIAQAESDVSGLRLAESAAYNLREALNYVVEGRDAAEGGLGAVLAAWEKFNEQTAMPGVDSAAARDELDQVLSQVAADRTRASYFARRLISYLEDRAGARTVKSPGDPVSEYETLRDMANSAVHSESVLAEAEALLARTIAWLVRVFSPPEEVADAIRALAAQPWSGPEQIAELKQLATVDHHLRLFFSAVTDPAWLKPLLLADVIRLPTHDAPWPGAALLIGLGKTNPQAVADLLASLMARTKKEIPPGQRAAVRFELLRMAVQLDPPAYGVVTEVMQRHGDLPSARSLGVSAGLKADATDSVVLDVADAELNYFGKSGVSDRYDATRILDHLQTGVTENNVAARARMLAGKTRRLVESGDAGHAWLGIEALTVPLGEHPDPLLVFAHHLGRILTKARQWQVPTAQQLDWLGPMQGEVGGRLRGHVLAGASDAPVTEKIAHVTERIASSATTAEDLALVTDITSCAPAPEDLAAWANALGAASPASADAEAQIASDWARAWRWAAVLPESVLTGWQEAIAYVSERYGAPDPQTLTGDRAPEWVSRYAQSPYSAEELSARPPLETAALVAAWEPDAESDRRMSGRPELAGTLGEVVKANPVEWSADPQGVAAALARPLYVESYFRALTEQAANVVSQAPAILAAALALALAGGGQAGGRDAGEEGAFEEGWQKVVLRLAGALANNDSDLAASLDTLWGLALAAVQSAPTADIGLLFSGKDPLSSAFNRTWGHGLQAVLAVAAWEFRRNGTVRPEFEQTLNVAVGATGSAGLEFRAILAASRPLLETIAANWLEAHAGPLFRQGTLAQQTFDLTVKWPQPTTWLYREFRSELFDAALRGVDSATRLIVVAALHEENGYDLATVIRRMQQDAALLAAAVENAVFLVQGAETGSPQLAVAIRFWTLLINADRGKVPPEVLIGLGRWAFVANIDDEQWADLTARTLDAADGSIKYPISVADRAARLPASRTIRSIFLRLLDTGDPWERDHAADKALDVLRESDAEPEDDSFRRLRTRLIDLGYYAATSITRPA